MDRTASGPWLRRLEEHAPAAMLRRRRRRRGRDGLRRRRRQPDAEGRRAHCRLDRDVAAMLFDDRVHLFFY